MSTWIIGDVHGHHETLKRLLEAVSYDPTQDRVVFVGDLVCGGGGSAKVLRWAIEHNADVALGNHDLHMLAVAAGVRASRKKDDFDDVLRARDRSELLGWLRSRSLAVHIEEHQTLVVHAGVLPSWTVELTLKNADRVSRAVQKNNHAFETMYGNRPSRWKDSYRGAKRRRCTINALTRMRVLNNEGRMQFNYSGQYGWIPKGWMPWFEHPDRVTRDTQIVFGHWAALGVRRWREQNVVSLDGGVRWGRELCALRLEDSAIVSVPAAM